MCSFLSNSTANQALQISMTYTLSYTWFTIKASCWFVVENIHVRQQQLQEVQ